MPIQRTLSIIKPDAVAANFIGAINQMIEEAGLKIVAVKMRHLSKTEAESFYNIHRERPFFGELVEFMTSGPVLLQVLEGEQAVNRYRELMGATDPKAAKPNTIRSRHAKNVGENAVHGSDSEENAAIEIPFFFNEQEIFVRF